MVRTLRVMKTADYPHQILGLMDLALLMANAAQLKQIILTDGYHRFYVLMLSFIISSIVLQVREVGQQIYAIPWGARA